MPPQIKKRRPVYNKDGEDVGRKEPKVIKLSDMKKRKTNETQELKITVRDVTDSGALYVLAFIYAWFLGHNPLRVIISFFLQSLIFILLTTTIYGPFYLNSFYYAWDIPYRRELGENWSKVKPVVSAGGDEKKERPWWHWLLILAIRKGSAFHLIAAASAPENPMFVLSSVAAGSYYVMMLEKTGATDPASLFAAIKEQLTPPKASENQEETEEEQEHRIEKDQLDGLDSLFQVGAPVAAASFLIWALGSRGVAFTAGWL
ncbi:hypothetical protein HDU76_006463 [Blyttiomyces sp. JEL0837]|nr:hypothetical protein HDU76_006463 [Blyttiomyces sp. JEL0837]